MAIYFWKALKDKGRGASGQLKAEVDPERDEEVPAPELAEHERVQRDEADHQPLRGALPVGVILWDVFSGPSSVIKVH